jgi:hypothetical protein
MRSAVSCRTPRTHGIHRPQLLTGPHAAFAARKLCGFNQMQLPEYYSPTSEAKLQEQHVDLTPQPGHPGPMPHTIRLVMGPVAIAASSSYQYNGTRA